VNVVGVRGLDEDLCRRVKVVAALKGITVEAKVDTGFSDPLPLPRGVPKVGHATLLEGGKGGGTSAGGYRVELRPRGGSPSLES